MKNARAQNRTWLTRLADQVHAILSQNHAPNAFALAIYDAEVPALIQYVGTKPRTDDLADHLSLIAEELLLEDSDTSPSDPASFDAVKPITDDEPTARAFLDLGYLLSDEQKRHPRLRFFLVLLPTADKPDTLEYLASQQHPERTAAALACLAQRLRHGPILLDDPYQPGRG